MISTNQAKIKYRETEEGNKHSQDTVERKEKLQFLSHRVPLRAQTPNINNAMTAIGKHISIITLNINGLHSPIKSTDWLNRSRNKIPMSVVYKKCNLDLKKGTTLKYKSGQ